jgi:ABC-2 type transport system permease protein
VKQSERLRRFVRNVLAIAYKEASLLRHDQTLFTSVLVLPVMMTVVMGLALSFRPQQIRWAVLDQSDDPVSRRLIGDLAADPAFLPPIHVTSQEAGREQLAAAHLNAFVVIPYDFRRALERGRAEVQVQLDGSDPILAARVGGYVSQIAANLGAAGNQGREPADLVRGTRSAPGSPVDLRQQFRFNPTLDDREFYLAALSGFVLTNLCLSFAALGLVAEKENGTYEQMLAQPTSPLEVIVGKLVPNVVAGYLGLSVSLVAAGLMYGFWPVMLATLGIGVFVSSVARDSAQAVFVAVFFLMPSFVLSGSLLPYELMPHGVREFGGLLPLRWYQIIARRVIDRGAGLTQVLVPIGVLLSIFAVMMLAIRARMKPRLG